MAFLPFINGVHPLVSATFAFALFFNNIETAAACPVWDA